MCGAARFMTPALRDWTDFVSKFSGLAMVEEPFGIRGVVCGDALTGHQADISVLSWAHYAEEERKSTLFSCRSD